MRIGATKSAGKGVRNCAGKLVTNAFFIVGLVMKTTDYRYVANRVCFMRTQHPICYCYCRTIFCLIFATALYSRVVLCKRILKCEACISHSVYSCHIYDGHNDIKSESDWRVTGVVLSLLSVGPYLLKD